MLGHCRELRHSNASGTGFEIGRTSMPTAARERAGATGSGCQSGEEASSRVRPVRRTAAAGRRASASSPVDGAASEPGMSSRNKASVPPDSYGRAGAARPGLLARAGQATSLGPVWPGDAVGTDMRDCTRRSVRPGRAGWCDPGRSAQPDCGSRGTRRCGSEPLTRNATANSLPADRPDQPDIFRTRPSPTSATSTFPALSTLTPTGSSSSAPVAAWPSPDSPGTPFPATV